MLHQIVLIRTLVPAVGAGVLCFAVQVGQEVLGQEDGEGWGEGHCGGVDVDVHLLEHRLVDPTADLRGGVVVGRGEGRGEAESLLQVVLDDAGESARSSDRPQLQEMLSRLTRERDVDYVIVHKVDRLARNRADDVTINLAITKASAQLVSVSEAIDETPSGMLLHGIMSSIVQSAGRVVFRRWKVAPPFPIVQAEIEGDPERFAEREWEAAFRTVLGIWWESSASVRWSRDPRSWSDKASLLRLAQQLGAAVPDYEVSTAPRLPAGAIVSKAIGLDQAVVKGQRYATTLVKLPEMEYLFRGRQPCPVLLQEAVEVAYELRIGYSYGECAAVEQRKTDPEDQLADIRYAAVSRRAVPVPEDLARIFSQFAARASINIYSADVLVAPDGSTWLVDINPDGLFVAADDDRNTLAATFADGLLGQVS